MDVVRQAGRRLMRVVARGLNAATGGKVHPNTVTLVGLVMHIPVALLIVSGDWVLAAILLFVFGLFDTLDGDLARLQGRESANGMLLDSVTDRVKEVILYVGITYAFVMDGNGALAVTVATAALGCSLLTSYLNAMGDAIMARHKAREHSANMAFRGSLFPFEVRMLVLIVGLLAGNLVIAVAVLAIGAGYTALDRLIRVYRRLASS